MRPYSVRSRDFTRSFIAWAFFGLTMIFLGGFVLIG